MKNLKTQFLWKKLVFFSAAPVSIVGLTAIFLSHSTLANQSIVEGVKPLPIMQQAEGRTIFVANCAKCHGELADGREGLGPPLVHQIYRRGHHADIAFYRAAELGSKAHHWPFGDMPKQPQVTRDDMTKIIKYLRKLQNHNGVY